MTEPPEPSASESQRWLQWAREDLTLAQHAQADPDVVRRGACTWAHQAAEKALKALLVASGADPPKIHDLTRLARLTDDQARERLATVDLVELTRWAIEGRYPSDIEDASPRDAETAVQLAGAVVEVVARVLVGDLDTLRAGAAQQGAAASPIEAAIRARLTSGMVLTTPAREASFTIKTIDDAGLVLLLGSREWPTRLPWPAIEGIGPLLTGDAPIEVGGTYSVESRPGTLDHHLKQYVKTATAGWVAAVLEAAGVVVIDRRSPVTIRATPTFQSQVR
jgi:HEPN domain-containing protein